jgi:hypothetical protein
MSDIASTNAPSTFSAFSSTLCLAVSIRDNRVKIEPGREYLSRRGERVMITAVDPEGQWPVHYVVLTGPYKGVGARDGSRLTREGRASLLPDGNSPDHWNDLVAEYVPPVPAGDEHRE